MSRIGKLPVQIPAGVTVGVDHGTVRAKGPLGELSVTVPHGVDVEIADGNVLLKIADDQHGPAHGLARTLVHSAVEGVSKGYMKSLDIVGVGYRAELKGKNLLVNVGHSHPHLIEPPNGISFEVPDPTRIVIKGCDKQVVGQIAADVRGLRPPEPYKGKGIKYVGEEIRRKAGKTAAG
jgi:large subunit ribosomal protein L6